MLGRRRLNEHATSRPHQFAGRPVRVGSIVRVVSLPPRSSYVALPMKSRRVFRLIIGHPFRVYALTVPPGLPELRVSRVVDPASAVGSVTLSGSSPSASRSVLYEFYLVFLEPNSSFSRAQSPSSSAASGFSAGLRRYLHHALRSRGQLTPSSTPHS